MQRSYDSTCGRRIPHVWVWIPSQLVPDTDNCRMLQAWRIQTYEHSVDSNGGVESLIQQTAGYQHRPLISTTSCLRPLTSSYKARYAPLPSNGRPYMALVYLGLVAFSCLLVIITPLRPTKPQYRARLQSDDTSDGTTTVIIGAGVRMADLYILH